MVKKTTPPEPEAIPEFVVKLSGSSQIRVALTEFKGVEYVDIRKYYEANGEWKPTPKGVSIPLTDFNKVYSKLRRMKALIAEG